MDPGRRRSPRPAIWKDALSHLTSRDRIPVAAPKLAPDVIAVLEALPDGHAFYAAERDATGQILALRGMHMNEVGLRLRGMTLEDFVGGDLLERTRGLGNDAAADGYVAALNAGAELRRTLVTDALAGVRSFEVNAKAMQISGQEVLSISFRDVTRELHSRRRMQQAIELSDALSRTDELTGLTNRRGWQSAVEKAFRIRDARVSLAIADIDHFKRYNDDFGHLAGDGLLRGLARAWAGALAPEQLVARLGGEEFAFLLPGLSVSAASQTLEELATAVPDGQTVSIGVAARRGAETPSQVLARADESLYVAKRSGRARVVVAP
jgi:diguanylate cyclase (GGDEF)-like protein